MPLRFRNSIRKAALAAEKVTRTDMIYATRGGFWLTAASVVSGLVSFALAVAFANLLPARAYGVYKYILAVAGVLGAFSLTGLGTAMLRAVAQGHRGIIRDASRAGLRWSLGITVAALVGAGWYFRQGNAELAFGLLVVAIAAPIMNALSVCGVWYQGRKDFFTGSIFRMISSAASAAVLITLLFVTDRPELLILGFFLTNAVALSILYRYTMARIKEYEPLPKDVVPYAKHLSAMNVLSTAAQHVDKILIFQFLGAAPTAVYAFAQAIPEQVRGMSKNLYSLALPKFAENDPVVSRRELGRKLVIVGVLLGSITAAYILAAPYLFRFFFPNYIDAVPYSQALALLILIGGLGKLPNAWLTAQKAIKEKYLLSVLVPSLRLLLMAFLIMPYGIWGVVFAALIAKTMNVLLLLVLTYRHRLPSAGSR